MIYIKEKQRREAFDRFCLFEGKIDFLKAFVQNGMPLSQEDLRRFYDGMFEAETEIKVILQTAISGIEDVGEHKFD